MSVKTYDIEIELNDKDLAAIKLYYGIVDDYHIQLFVKGRAYEAIEDIATWEDFDED